MIIIVFDCKDILYICIRRILPQLIILKIMICRIGDAPSEWCFFLSWKILLLICFCMLVLMSECYMNMLKTIVW